MGAQDLTQAVAKNALSDIAQDLTQAVAKNALLEGPECHLALVLLWDMINTAKNALSDMAQDLTQAVVKKKLLEGPECHLALVLTAKKKLLDFRAQDLNALLEGPK